MAVGKVKWFDLDKGFGFIETEEGEDVYVSYEDIEGWGLGLRRGDAVDFEISEGRRGKRAISVRRLRRNDSARPRGGGRRSG